MGVSKCGYRACAGRSRLKSSAKYPPEGIVSGGTVEGKGMSGEFGVVHGAGSGSRLTIDNGAMGSCVVPRDPNRLLKENVEGKNFMNDIGTL